MLPGIKYADPTTLRERPKDEGKARVGLLRVDVHPGLLYAVFEGEADIVQAIVGTSRGYLVCESPRTGSVFRWEVDRVLRLLGVSRFSEMEDIGEW